MTDDTIRTSSARVPPSVPPAASFDDFELVRPLGQGGMGQVWLARDRTLGRPVAIKVLSDVTSSLNRERFLREARALARLSHPNVVAVYRVGDVERAPYIAYEFVPGYSLEKLPRPLDWAAVLAIAVGLARGLGAAHAEGILHRDIKPGNAVLSERGVVKLLDFGLAKLSDEPLIAPRAAIGSPPAGDPTRRGEPRPGSDEAVTVPIFLDPSPTLTPKELTQPGRLMGTPAYMAPELWRGEEATERSDLYALGLVLFELLTGKLPHAGRPLQIMAQQIVHQRLPSIAVVCPDAPASFGEAIDGCIRREPGERLASVAAFRNILEEARLALQSGERPSSGVASARVAPQRPRSGATTSPPVIDWGATFALAEAAMHAPTSRDDATLLECLAPPTPRTDRCAG